LQAKVSTGIGIRFYESTQALCADSDRELQPWLAWLRALSPNAQPDGTHAEDGNQKKPAIPESEPTNKRQASCGDQPSQPKDFPGRRHACCQ